MKKFWVVILKGAPGRDTFDSLGRARDFAAAQAREVPGVWVILEAYETVQVVTPLPPVVFRAVTQPWEKEGESA